MLTDPQEDPFEIGKSKRKVVALREIDEPGVIKRKGRMCVDLIF